MVQVIFYSGGVGSVDFFFGASWWCVAVGAGSCLSLRIGYDSGDVGSAHAGLGNVRVLVYYITLLLLG